MMIILPKVNRRSFLKKAGAAVFTIVAIPPGLSTVSMSAVEQLKKLDMVAGTDIMMEKVSKIYKVPTTKFEKAFMLGFNRGDYKRRPVHMDVMTPDGKEFHASMTVGRYGDQCSPKFSASFHMAEDFDFMVKTTRSVRDGVEAYFSMPKQERQLANRQRSIGFKIANWRNLGKEHFRDV